MTDALSRLDGVIEDELTEDELRNLVKQAKQATRKEWVLITCEDCGKRKKYQVDVHSPAEAIKNIATLLEQSKGRAGQRNTTAQTSQVLTDFATMTDEQLAAVIAEGAQSVSMP